ncbi:unannotated protein [freshwater metagenome]|uniref:Unannotated protein n=1 Tax=freshwater metagenome TaxID=449393 RepID=A0A6J7KBB1_9ZZZZ|nr:hypothetical protein [Actinomycetota bacterium]
MSVTPIKPGVEATRAELPPVRCASWCVHGDGHPGSRHREDQYCYSIYLEMKARLHVDPDEGDTVTVYARKDADNDQPFVVVCTPDDVEMRLTNREVHGLIERLQHAAWVAEQDRRERGAFDLGRDSVR